ncbi:uncharacterized protein LOC144112850 [Amblyomma americanum]
MRPVWLCCSSGGQLGTASGTAEKLHVLHVGPAKNRTGCVPASTVLARGAQDSPVNNIAAPREPLLQSCTHKRRSMSVAAGSEEQPGTSTGVGNLLWFSFWAFGKLLLSGGRDSGAVFLS